MIFLKLRQCENIFFHTHLRLYVENRLSLNLILKTENYINRSVLLLSQLLIHQSDNIIKNNKFTYNGAKNYQNFFHFSSFFAKISFKYCPQKFL